MELKWARRNGSEKRTASIATSAPTNCIGDLGLTESARGNAWEPKTLNWQRRLTTSELWVCLLGEPRESLPRRRSRRGQRRAKSFESTRRTATRISTKRTESGRPWKTKRNIVKRCFNSGMAFRLILPGLRLAIVITRGETIRAFGMVWETGKWTAN